jgi:hypothetical protein
MQNIEVSMHGLVTDRYGFEDLKRPSTWLKDSMVEL